jgi:hypothetical protein
MVFTHTIPSLAFRFAPKRNQRDLHTPLNTRRQLKGRKPRTEIALPVRHAAKRRTNGQLSVVSCQKIDNATSHQL